MNCCNKGSGPAPMPATVARIAAVGIGLLFGALAVGQDQPAPEVAYDRSLYEHWTDADGDCQDTRQEVLIAESLRPVELDASGCRVVSGAWFDPFTGMIVTEPSRLDIDHFVPLAEAHRSGADSWDAEQRERFANNLFHLDGLIAVTASVNRSKGDRDPSKWLPPNEAYRCEYVRDWVIYKVTWGLSMDEDEEIAVRRILQDCGLGTRVAAKKDEPGEPDVSDASEESDAAAESKAPEKTDISADPDGEDTCTDVNTADSVTLQKIVGIGPAKAQAIIDYREANGPFESIEALDDASGIGAATLENVRSGGFCVTETASPDGV